MITIHLNGERYKTEAKTLEDLIKELQLEEDVIATAVDTAFVPRPSRAGHVLIPECAVDIVAPMQGG